MTTRHFFHLGKMLCRDHPELADQLSQKLEAEKPLFSDMSLLPVILEEFCKTNNISLDMIKGRENGKLSKKTIYKHTFIAVIVKLYSPSTLGPRKEISVSLLRKNLSILLETRSDRISRIVSNVRSQIVAYKSFAKEVEENYTIILKTNGIKESK